MNRGQLDRLARQTLRELGLRQPLDVDQLRTRLGDRQGKPIDVVGSTALSGRRTFGFTASRPGAECDVIMYEARTTWEHQIRIILHELAHMICGHLLSAVDHSYRAGHAEQYQTISPHMLAEVLGQHPPRRWRPRLPRTSPRPTSGAFGRSLYDDPVEWEAETLATILSAWVPGLGDGYVAPEPANPLHSILGDVTGW